MLPKKFIQILKNKISFVGKGNKKAFFTTFNLGTGSNTIKQF